MRIADCEDAQSQPQHPGKADRHEIGPRPGEQRCEEESKAQLPAPRFVHEKDDCPHGQRASERNLQARHGPPHQPQVGCCYRAKQPAKPISDGLPDRRRHFRQAEPRQAVNTYRRGGETESARQISRQVKVPCLLRKLSVRPHDCGGKPAQKCVERRDKPVGQQANDIPAKPGYAAAGLAWIVGKEVALRGRQHVVAVYVAIIYGESQRACVSGRGKAHCSSAPHRQHASGQAQAPACFARCGLLIICMGFCRRGHRLILAQ